MRPMLGSPPFDFICVKINSRFRASLFPMTLKLQLVTEASERKDWKQHGIDNRLPFHTWLSTLVGESMEYCTVLDKMLCVPPQSMCPSVLCIAFQF